MAYADIYNAAVDTAPSRLQILRDAEQQAPAWLGATLA